MIPFKKFISITSGVGGASQVDRRELIGRLFTTSPLIGADTVLEFSSASAVSDYFGSGSDEYKRALFYFDYVAPNISSPQKLSFYRYSSLAFAPIVYGGRLPTPIGTLQGVESGEVHFDFGGGDIVAVTNIDLTTALSLANVATLLTAEFAASTDVNVAACIVTYDATNARFIVTGGLTDKPNMSFTTEGAFGGTDLAELLGLYTSQGAINANGATGGQTPVGAVTASVNLSNNFGSFAFIPSLTIEEHAAIAEYNAGLNVMFQYMVPVALADYVSWGAALIGFAGTALTLSPLATEYPELVPMIQLAATDYTRRNATVNYMFKQFALTPSVSTEALSDALDAARINYYGVTQQAGQNLAFYQRGVLMGGVTDPLDMNVYANEQWLKDAVGVDIMDLLLSSGRVPANDAGRDQILAVIQGPVDQALFNGTISVGKSLTLQQKNFITEQTGDERAWQQIETAGYWVSASIVPYVADSGITEYKAVYILLYSKDDAIRFVSGNHLLV